MRRGLMVWQETKLGVADVSRRQEAMREAMREAGLDAVLAYTNLVRSAAVSYLTGFTPYWSDALLLVTHGDRPLFATALSKRVGTWIASVNPTAEIAHAPRPGTLISKRLSERNLKRVGIIEPDLLPSGLQAELLEHADIEIADASALLAAVRGRVDPAELRLARRATEIALLARDAVSPEQRDAGAVAGAAERAARLAGAEECYVAIVPDLSLDMVFRQPDNRTSLGERFAIRLSVAHCGVWVRVSQTFSFGQSATATAAIQDRFTALAAAFDPARPAAPQIAAMAIDLGVDIGDWWLEGPVGTLPLDIVARASGELTTPIGYGVLSVVMLTAKDPVICTGPVGLSHHFPG